MEVHVRYLRWILSFQPDFFHTQETIIKPLTICLSLNPLPLDQSIVYKVQLTIIRKNTASQH